MTSNAPPTIEKVTTSISVTPGLRQRLRMKCAEEGGISYDEYLRRELALEGV